MKHLLLVFTLIFGAALAPQALASGKEPAIQAQPMVNINSASAAEIAETLHGIGLKKAEEIVAWRQQHGPFKSVDDLARIKGIGQATLDRNRSRIKLN